MMSRKCKYCCRTLDEYRHGSALYCGYDCYYSAKKKRSNQRYQMLSNDFHIKSRNESILEQFYALAKKDIEITYEMLDALDFDWGYACSEIADSHENIWKVIGCYYYLINKDKTINIWKQENSGP